MAWVSLLHSTGAAWAVCLRLSAAVHSGLPARRSGSFAGLGMGGQASAQRGVEGEWPWGVPANAPRTACQAPAALLAMLSAYSPPLECTLAGLPATAPASTQPVAWVSCLWPKQPQRPRLA